MVNAPTSLNCPACGAPLDTDGTHTIVRCNFCGNVLLVPGVLPPRAVAPKSALDEIRGLLDSGDRNEAVERYRQIYNVDSREASDAIDALQAGRLATPSAKNSPAPEELIRALQEVQRLISSGDKTEAIRVYRESYDVSRARAAYAVDQIEAGQTIWPEAGFCGSDAPVQEVAAPTGVKWVSVIIALSVFILVIGFALFALLGQGGPLNSHYSPSGPVTMLPAESQTETGTEPDFSALLYDPEKDIRFIGLIDGTTGKLRWQTDQLSGDGYADAIVAGPDLVYTANGADLLANRISDGSLAWQVEMPDKLNYGDATLLVTAGLVITNNVDQSIQAYEADTGRLVWSRRLSGYDRALRLLGGSLGVIDYFDGQNDYGLVLLDPATGRQQQVIAPTCEYEDYSYEGLDPQAGLVYDQSTHALYIISDAPYTCLTRIDLTSGRTVWQMTDDSNMSLSADGFRPLMTDSTLYFGNGNDLLAVDKADGTLKTLLTDPDYEFRPLDSSGKKLIVRARKTRGTERFELWGVDPVSGEQAWKLDMQAEPIDPPDALVGLVDKTDWGWTWKLVPDGLVIMTFQGEPNQLILETFNPADGSSLGQQTIALKKVSGDFYSAPEVIGWVGNTLYFSLESNLYALDLDTRTLKVIY